MLSFIPDELSMKDDRHVVVKKQKSRMRCVENALICSILVLVLIMFTIMMFAVGATHEPTLNMHETLINNLLAFGTALCIFFGLLYGTTALMLSLEILWMTHHAKRP